MLLPVSVLFINKKSATKTPIQVNAKQRVNDFSDTNVMSELWRQSIKDNIVKGDQMILDNVIVQLKNGTKILAPAITFKVIQ